MCGRVVCALDTDSLIRIARAHGMRNQIRYSPSYNVAPTRYIGAICRKRKNMDGDCENLKQEENEINSLKASDKKISEVLNSEHPTQDNISPDDNLIKNDNLKIDNDLKLKFIENNDNEDIDTNFDISDDKEPNFYNEFIILPEKNSKSRNTSHGCMINHEQKLITNQYLNTKKSDEASPQENESNTSALLSQHSFDLEAMKWGTRTKDNYFVINARSETIHITSFKNFKRCVLIIEGYFEWKQENKASQPYYIHNKLSDYMLIAGLYKDTHDKDGFEEKEMVIVTKSAIKQIDFIHHRMPIILTEDQIDDYLLKEVTLEEILRSQCDSLKFDKAVSLNFYQVGDLVNKLGNQGKDNLLHKEEIKYDKNKNLKLSNFFGKKCDGVVCKIDDIDKNNIFSNEEKRDKKLGINDLHRVEKIYIKKEYDVKTNSNFDEDATTQASNINNNLGTSRKENKSNLKNRKRKSSSISEKVKLSGKMKKDKSGVKIFKYQENINKISPRKNFNTKIMENFVKTSKKTNLDKEIEKY